MKPISFILVLFLLEISFMGSSQFLNLEWEKQLGTSKMDMFIDVVEDINGGFTVLGSTYQNNKDDQDFWLVRFTSTGDTLWMRVVGTQNHDYPLSLAQLPDGSYVLAGKTETDTKNYQAFIFKTDANGNKLWQKNIGNEQYKCVENVIAANASETIISGIKTTDNDVENIWIAKLDSEGRILWEKLVSDDRIASSQSLKHLPDGSFVMAGSIKQKNIPDANLMVIRFSDDGEEIWKYEQESIDKNVWPECICCSPDSNFIVVGWHGVCMNDITSEYPVFDYDLFVAKISKEGKLVWTKNIDSEGSEGGNAVVVRADGTILLAGKKETSFLGKVGPWLLLSDGNGNVLDELLLPFKFNKDQAVQIVNSSDGGFVVIGPGEVGPDYSRSDGWIKKFKAF
jgi:hypothetical protein